MKKRFFLLSLALLTLISTTVFAAQAEGILPRASYYLDAYYIDFEAEGDGIMCISVLVEGVGVQDKIGISYIDIEEKVGNRWCYFDTLEAADYPYFYDYDTDAYMDDVYFEGTPGVEYRATICIYAGKGGGGDNRTITTNSYICY